MRYSIARLKILRTDCLAIEYGMASEDTALIGNKIKTLNPAGIAAVVAKS